MQSKNYKTIHPALDFVDNILFLGFSDKGYDYEEKKWETKNTHLVVRESNGEPSIEIINETQIEINGVLYVFEPDSNNKQRKLPRINEKWSKELLNKCKWNLKSDPMGTYHKIKSNLQAYIKLEKEEDYDIITAYAISTYFFPLFKAIGYLHFKAMKGSGKTTSLNILKLLTFNGSKEIATPATMRDKIDGQRATFIVDQADNYLGAKSLSGMVDIFVDGYKKSGGKISKMVEIKRQHVPVDFDTYSPKVFGSIKELHPDLKDRCIQIPLIKSKANLQFLDEDSEVWLSLRDDLYRLQMANFAQLEALYKQVNIDYKMTNEIINRQLELWSPLEAVMRLCIVSNERIGNCKRLFKLRGKNTEDQLTSNDWAVINYILEQLKESETIWISLKEISSAVMLCDEDEDDPRKLSEKSKHARNIISRLNLASDKGRVAGKGNVRFLFEKSRVKEIEANYLTPIEEEYTSQIITGEENQANTNEF
jgi:hypothetical protein